MTRCVNAKSEIEFEDAAIDCDYMELKGRFIGATRRDSREAIVNRSDTQTY